MYKTLFLGCAIGMLAIFCPQRSAEARHWSGYHEWGYPRWNVPAGFTPAKPGDSAYRSWGWAGQAPPPPIQWSTYYRYPPTPWADSPWGWGATAYRYGTRHWR